MNNANGTARTETSQSRKSKSSHPAQEQFFATLNSILTPDTAQRIAKRLELLSKSAGLPESGYGDVRAVAAYLNIAEDGAAKLLRRMPGIPRHQPGASILYRFSDLAKAATSGGAE